MANGLDQMVCIIYGRDVQLFSGR